MVLSSLAKCFELMIYALEAWEEFEKFLKIEFLKNDFFSEKRTLFLKLVFEVSEHCTKSVYIMDC